MEAFDLTHRKPYQRISMPDRMIYECQQLVSRERDKPKREFGEVDRDRIVVHTVQAAAGNEASCEHDLVGACKIRGMSMDMPSLNQRISQLAAGLHQKGPGTRRWIANLQVEDLLWAGIGAVRDPQVVEHGLERSPDDGFGEFAGRVVGTGPPPFFARLQHYRTRRDEIRGRVLVDHTVKRRVQRFKRGRFPDCLADLVRELPVRAIPKPLGPPASRFAE